VALETWVRKDDRVSMDPGNRVRHRSAVVDEGWRKGVAGEGGQNSAGGVVGVLGPAFRAVGEMEAYVSLPIG
jgi:hypothetical protein